MAYSLRAFEEFCRGLTLKDGGTLEVEAFQRRILRDHFRGVVEEVVVIPKKNGKTTLLGALALFHLREWPKADVVVVAASAEQAGILFERAADRVESSGLGGEMEVRGRFGGAYRQIRLVADASARIRVIAADAKTADGVLPTLALVDELHRHRNGELYGVLSDGVDARGGRMVTISTAGEDLDSPLGLVRSRAEAMDSYRRRGAYCHAQSDDGMFVLHEWSLRDDADRENIDLVKKANPLSLMTVEHLRRRRESPLMTPGRWARYACGVWTSGEEAWLEASEWDGLRVDIGGVADGEKVYAAVVYGQNPAIAVAAARPEDATIVEDEDETTEVLGTAVKVWVYEGKPRYPHLERELVLLSQRYDLVSVAFDAGEFGRSAELLEARGLPMVEVPHSNERRARATATLQRVIHAGILRHDGDPKLRSQMLRSVVKESQRQRFLEISDGSRGVVAMAVAVHQATQVQPAAPTPMIVVGKVG